MAAFASAFDARETILAIFVAAARIAALFRMTAAGFAEAFHKMKRPQLLVTERLPQSSEDWSNMALQRWFDHRTQR